MSGSVGGAESNLPAGSEAGGGVPPQVRIPLAELDEPLLGARLRTRYQPIVRLSDRVAVGLEVLARLDHPAHGTVSPEHFVPQMENAGLSAQLAEAVAIRAFADYPTDIAPLGLTLALNLPLDVLMHPETIGWLERRRQEAGVPSGRVIIELTETRPVADLDAGQFHVLGAAVATLRLHGYGIAIDDVTPGMVGHRDLLALGFTLVKLDKGIVADSADHAEAAGFVASITAAAHTAGLMVIAEGVKDKETWDRMRGLGVDLGQGFLVARPLPAQGVRVWLEAWQKQV